jgi:peptidoglycan hydrolase CwlO-like protein
VEFLDRSAYRMYSDTSLREMAKYNPSAELAIVLAERLDEVQAELDSEIEKLTDRANDLQIDLNQLDDKVYLLQHEITYKDATIASLTASIEFLKEQKND